MTYGSAIGEEEALAQILWHMTLWGFTPEHEGFRDDTPSNIFECKAKELERRQFLNRAKRMRDARQERSIARLERMGKIQRLIDRIMISQPGYALCPENRQAGVLMLKPAAEPPIIPKI